VGCRRCQPPPQVLFRQSLEGDVDQALVDLAYHFGVNGDLYIEGGRLGDSEVVAFEEAWCATVEGVENLFEELVGKVYRVSLVQAILAEETTIQVGGKLKCLPDVLRGNGDARHGTCC
jgi:hypothetical protein